MKVFTSLIFGFSLANAPILVAVEKHDPIVGRWRWIERQIVECREDGTFLVKPNNRKGTWKLVPATSVEKKYHFTWDDGLYTDTLMMSRDGKKLAGKNQDGKKIEAVKLD